jgi:hypothetical protein
MLSGSENGGKRLGVLGKGVERGGKMVVWMVRTSEKKLENVVGADVRRKKVQD